MFNGIIKELGTVISVKSMGGGKEITIAAGIASSMEVDNSLCVNGVCQTVIRQNQRSVAIQVVEETMRKTTLGNLKVGDEVNLERSLTLSQRIDGHIVQGHVDTTGILIEISKEGADRMCTIGYDPGWHDLVVGRGSIAIDGISLTIARVAGNTMTVAIIPYTWDHTVLKHRKKGDKVNLEFDILGKYVVRYLQNRESDSKQTSGTTNTGDSGISFAGGKGAVGEQSDKTSDAGGVTREMLRDSGFMK